MTASQFHLSDSLHQRSSNSTLLVATLILIRYVYSKRTSSLAFSLWSYTAAADRVQTDLLTEILPSVDVTKFTYVIEKGGVVQSGADDNDSDDEQKQCLQRGFAFLLVDSFESFMFFRDKATEQNFEVSGFYSIIYTGKLQGHYEVVEKMFQEMFKMFVVNVIVLVELPRETLYYSYYPFTQYHCNKVVPVLLNRFTLPNGLIYKKYFFANKTKNFHGCRMTVATWNSPPFISFTKLPNGKVHINGIEGKLLKLLSRRMNFTIKAVDAGSRGRVYRNLTVSEGAVKLVINGEADLTINSFLHSKYFLKTMTASYAYMSYAMVVAVPMGQPLTSFQRLMRPFRYIIWSCLSASVLAGIMIIFIIKFIQKRSVRNFVFGPLNSIPFTNLLNTLFGGPVTVTPERNFARYVLMIWIIYTMVVRHAYISELFILLQDSTVRNNFRSIEELVENNFTIVYSDNAIDVLYGSMHAHNRKVISDLRFHHLNKLHDQNSKNAVVLLRPYLRYYNNVVRDKSPIQTLPKALVTVHLVMYLRRNSFLVGPINNHLLDIMSGGILKAWNQYHLPHENIMQEMMEGEPAKLSVKLLLALFIVYLFCLGVGMLVFGLELWSRYSPICRAVVNFLNY